MKPDQANRLTWIGVATLATEGHHDRQPRSRDMRSAKLSDFVPYRLIEARIPNILIRERLPEDNLAEQ